MSQALAAFRKRWRARLGADTRFLDGKLLPSGLKDVEWLSESGQPLERGRMAAARPASPDHDAGVARWRADRDRSQRRPPRRGVRGAGAPRLCAGRAAAGTERDIGRHLDDGALLIAGRSVVYLSEEAGDAGMSEA